ncbi:MAG: DivIVA domain-containing protein [Solirubrobacterales bacterium]|nr:DivIVA domain-containing protein [Solirubrobacterales bacterium]
MPDQSSAADEHALIQEITAPLEKLPDDPLPIAADVNFPLALRGYDRIAVDAYVKKASQLVAELQATRSPDSAVRRALERVGQEVSGILQRAHETSEQITTQSRREAEERLERARQEATKITADAHNRLKDLDSETDRIWAERQQIVEDTRELARQLLALADSAAERFPPAEEHAAPPAAAHAAAPAVGAEAAPKADAPPAAEGGGLAAEPDAPAPAEGGELAPEADSLAPADERPRPAVFDHAATADDDSAPGADEKPVTAPGGLEGEGHPGPPAHPVDAPAEDTREHPVESGRKAAPAHAVDPESDLPDDEATAVLPPVRPTESNEQRQ